ncbi:unnamed protein product [Effrenium voratum]|uniref:Uncharacterized protein n=1 Tax=Effrenium voratum TaxID=2562239 RepID=A0AA36IW68_9DINO|nr:unnamed protein product [Effrenium voratum]
MYRKGQVSATGCKVPEPTKARDTRKSAKGLPASANVPSLALQLVCCVTAQLPSWRRTSSCNFRHRQGILIWCDLRQPCATDPNRRCTGGPVDTPVRAGPCAHSAVRLSQFSLRALLCKGQAGSCRQEGSSKLHTFMFFRGPTALFGPRV